MGKTAFLILLFLSCTFAHAQEWNKADSIWLMNVLEGKEIPQINEDTKKAIEEGRLAIPAWMKSRDARTEMDLMKDFDNAGKSDSSKMLRIDPYSMPPGVFKLYVLYVERMDSTYQDFTIMLSEEDINLLKALAPPGGHDFNHALSMVFSKRYRQLVYNRKHATAYKNYYDAGAPNPIRITERERQQLNRSINSSRPTFKVPDGNKRNGIDN